jgi:endonuclease/exonuclease/phosphatase family metal-dependent hydrolase
MTQPSDKPKRRSWTNWFVLLLNALCAVGIVLAYLSCHVSPSTIGYLALFGLAYPFLLLGNILFVVYWFFKKRRFIWFSLIPLVLGIGHFFDFFQISSPDAALDNEKGLKVMTWNVHLFNLYDKSNRYKKRNEMFEIIRKENADIYCFQEFYHTERQNYFTTKDSLLEMLPTKFHHERYTHAVKGDQYFGVAIFSKYPIIKKGYVPFTSDVNNFCIYVDIKVHKDTVRVYNAHFQSIRFQPEDYALMDGNSQQEEIESGGKRIAKRLMIAFDKREEQVERVAASIRDSPYPVILCGDFNDTPVSYTYETLSDELNDSFVEAGSGIGNTYIGVFPSFRIDYIMHSENMRATKYETLPSKLTDHHPVVSQVVWVPN